MTLGGAAQREEYPKCPCCGILIMGSPVSLTVGAAGPMFFCGDGHGCRRRAALRIPYLLGLLRRTDAEAGIISRSLRAEIAEALEGAA